MSERRRPHAMPLMDPGHPFSLDEARACAELVAYAYEMHSQWEELRRPRERESFVWSRPKQSTYTLSEPIWGDGRETRFIPDEAPFGFLAERGDGAVFVALRGSATPMDMVKNFNGEQKEMPFARGRGLCHEGYLNVYLSLREPLMALVGEHLDAPRWFLSGHSLGSALSTFATIDLALTLRAAGKKPEIYHYNFASARVGDIEFAAAYEELAVPTFRVANTTDIVPSLPPAVLGSDSFHHVGVPVAFSAHYGSVPLNHILRSYLYAMHHPDHPRAPDPEEETK